MRLILSSGQPHQYVSKTTTTLGAELSEGLAVLNHGWPDATLVEWSGYATPVGKVGE